MSMAIIDPRNPYPGGPVQVHPRKDALAQRRRRIKHDVRAQIRDLRRELARKAEVRAPAGDFSDRQTVKDLREIAKARGIKGASRMNKDRLIEVLTS